MVSSSSWLVVAVAALLLGAASATMADDDSNGLSLDFYKASCPQAESIVYSFLQDAIARDVGLAAGLLRLHFHDCFVQGCDASVLLDKLPGGDKSEKEVVPNMSLRKSAFDAVDELRDRLEQACGGLVVSCADILALAARDSVHLAGGPWYDVPLGRFDGLTYAAEETVLASLPPPGADVTELLGFFGNVSLDKLDLVTLSGAHTLGIAHCGNFQNRLFPARDPTMDEWFFNQLKLTCPVEDTDNTTVNDIRTPNTFDNKYYVDLVSRQGLFSSDQDLFTNATTRPLVAKFAKNQKAFFHHFKRSMVKMGQIQVLNSAQGQIRKKCSVRNSNDLPSSIIEAVEEMVL